MLSLVIATIPIAVKSEAQNFIYGIKNGEMQVPRHTISETDNGLFELVIRPWSSEPSIIGSVRILSRALIDDSSTQT